MAESSVVETAEGLASLVSDKRAHSEHHGCLATEVVDACRSAGLFMLNAPEEAGGWEASPREIFETVEIIARADPSVSWYLSNSTPACLAAAWIDPNLWERLYAGRGNFGFSAAPGGRLEPTESGFTLTGEWPLVTGIDDAGWAALNCLLVEPGSERPVIRMALVDTGGLEIDEIWQDAVAMKGTGSHRVVADQVFVPTGLIVDLGAPPLLDRPRYQSVKLPHIGGVTNAAVSVGILDHALSTTAELLRTKVSTVSGAAAAKNTGILELVADARLGLWNARAGALAAADQLGACVEDATEPTPELRAMAVGAQFETARVARQTISDLYARSSRAAFFAGHPLEQSLRDIHAVAYGFEPLRMLHHDIGRITLGLDPAMPGF